MASTVAEPGEGANALHRVHAELEWIDGKRTVNLLQERSVERADILRLNHDMIKVGFLEERPTTSFGIPIPMWLDIQTDKIVAIREVQV